MHKHHWHSNLPLDDVEKLSIGPTVNSLSVFPNPRSPTYANMVLCRSVNWTVSWASCALIPSTITVIPACEKISLYSRLSHD